MPASQNGWPVVDQGDVIDRAVLGVEFPNGWLRGDVDTVFTYLVGRLHRDVEPMVSPGCWGWYVKTIEGGTTISNHASGTAFDYNAPKHPMGTRNTYSATKRAKIRAILAELDDVVRWGGDYAGRPDDMHFEINKGRAAVATVAARIRREAAPAMAAVETTTLLTGATNTSWTSRKINPTSANPDPTAAIVWLFAYYAAYDARKVATEARDLAQQALDAANAAGAAAVAARNATEALTHDPADGGNTAEQDSLKAALGL